MKVFLSGPISSNLDGYKEQFSAAEKAATAAGYTVINPAVLPIGMEPGDYMMITMAMIEVADMVLLLDGWDRSGGARLEAGYAEYIKKPTKSMRDLIQELKQKEEPVPKPRSRVERMFGPKEEWGSKEAPAQEPRPERPEGYKGFFLIRCPECGEIKGFCSRSYITETTCRSCGAVIQLEDLIPAHVHCEKCGSYFKYRTNINTQEPVSFSCLECKAPVDLQMNSKGTALVTLGDRRGGGTDNDPSFRSTTPYWLKPGTR